MNFDQLIYFIETAKTQHIRKAAKILNISPSAISHSIKSLEEELGHNLFEKKGTSIYLTTHGQMLVQKIEPILAQLQTVKEEFQSKEIPLKGHFKLACTHGLADKIIAPMIANIQKKFPELNFELYSLRSAQVVDEVVKRAYDFGFCFSPTPNPALIISPIFADKMSVAVKSNHPILELSPNVTMQKQIKELSNYPLAAPKAFQGIEICENHPGLIKLGITKRAQFVFDSYDVAASILRNSNYWCLIPDVLLTKYNLKKFNLKNFNENVSIALVTPNGRPLSGVMYKLIEDNIK